MYATNFTYVSIRAVYQMPHIETLTVETLRRSVESTLEGNNCLAVFVMNQAESRWMLPVGFKLLDVRQKYVTQSGVQNTPARVVKG